MEASIKICFRGEFLKWEAEQGKRVRKDGSQLKAVVLVSRK